MPDDSTFWQFPYSSRRSPVLARNVVAASQPLAAQAGLRMLLKGGNAVDAALATAMALTVVEPTMNGLGSDAFAMVWDGKQLHGLNASGRSPAGWTVEFFQKLGRIPKQGWHSVTVPGAVSAWVELSKKFGKLKFEELFGPAIDYAREGYLVSPIVAGNWQEDLKSFRLFEHWMEVFAPGGKTPAPGQRVVLADHARSLEMIAQSKGEEFYRGRLAQAIAREAKAGGGLVTEQDLAEHRADWVTPIDVEYRGYKLHEIPPNGQGLAALMALGILKHHKLSELAADCPDALHLQIESMKLALADAHRYVCDPESMTVKVEALLDENYLASRSRLIDLNRAGAATFGVPAKSDTVYLTTADASGMMVSYIQSNYSGFGSGIVIPGTGIAMQNRGSAFVLDPAHPNCIGPRKRPFHTIIPAFVTREGKPVMSFGVMGGAMQAQGHVQMMTRIFDHGQNPQAAADAPRWQVSGDELLVEEGIAESTLEELKRRGHRIRKAGFGSFGGAQLIYKLQDGYLAASEKRKDGQAVGY